MIVHQFQPAIRHSLTSREHVVGVGDPLLSGRLDGEVVLELSWRQAVLLRDLQCLKIYELAFG